MSSQDRANLRYYREFVRLTGVPPPKIQCPGGMLSPWVREKLVDHPDLVDWAMGRLVEEECNC